MHLTPQELDKVQRILKAFLPEGCKVFAFGSRVHGRNLKKFSDLDLAIDHNGQRLDSWTLLELKEVFTASLLPWRVDVVDLNAVSDEFRAIVDEQKVPFPLD